MQLLTKQRGLAEAINERLDVLKVYRPYHESDHVLNIGYKGEWGYNALVLSPPLSIRC